MAKKKNENTATIDPDRTAGTVTAELTEQMPLESTESKNNSVANEPKKPDDKSGSTEQSHTETSVILPELAAALAGQPAITSNNSIDLLKDVELNVKIELGRTKMYVEDVLKLSEGSIVELDKLAGDPVDIFVNERLIARGEVLVLNDTFCVRVNQIVSDCL